MPRSKFGYPAPYRLTLQWIGKPELPGGLKDKLLPQKKF